MNTVIRNLSPAKTPPRRRPMWPNSLSSLLRAARPHVEAIDVDDEHHVATVLISADEDTAIVGFLSLNRKRGVLRLDVRLGSLDDLSVSQAAALLELNGKTRFSWVHWEPEYGIVSVRGVAMCSEDGGEAIRALGDEIVRTLREDVIGRLFGNGRNGTHRCYGGAV